MVMLRSKRTDGTSSLFWLEAHRHGRGEDVMTGLVFRARVWLTNRLIDLAWLIARQRRRPNVRGS